MKAPEDIAPLPENSPADTCFVDRLNSSRDNSLLRDLESDHEGDSNHPNREKRQVRSGHYVLTVPVPLESPELVLHSQDLASLLGFSEELCRSRAFLQYFSGDIGAADQEHGWSTPYGKSWYGEYIGYRVNVIKSVYNLP